MITITPADLVQRVRDSRKTTIVASVWEPGMGASLTRFLTEHIPNAQFCDTSLALAGIPSSQEGRNPLPDPLQLQRWFVKMGVNAESPVVVYDYGKGFLAARAWWILKWAGVPDVRILDGGIDGWRRAGLPVVGGPGNFPATSTLRPHIGQLPTATLEDVKAHQGILVDCRERSRYSGQKESLDLKAGHIPGAVNLPSLDLLHEDYTFKSPEEIRAKFAEIGVTSGENVIVYSGSGLHSAQMIATMHHAGLPGAALFVGGWSQWSADRSNPVQRVD
ncbi:sulfurtransferase [Corynebacterium sp. H127]|uniref:sulfurtransferase n=1 Tax=Corynebacterium sp. H127 TaxID=3133418 RepID=UPI00309F07F6